MGYLKASAMHKDPKLGARFWVERTQKRGVTPRAIEGAGSVEELVGLIGDSDQSLLHSHTGY